MRPKCEGSPIYIYICRWVRLRDAVCQKWSSTKGRVFVFWTAKLYKKYLSRPSIGVYPSKAEPKLRVKQRDPHDPLWMQKVHWLPKHFRPIKSGGRVPLFNPSFLRQKPFIWQPQNLAETAIFIALFGTFRSLLRLSSAVFGANLAHTRVPLAKGKRILPIISSQNASRCFTPAFSPHNSPKSKLAENPDPIWKSTIFQETHQNRRQNTFSCH